jgi:hypothetical protein
LTHTHTFAANNIEGLDLALQQNGQVILRGMLPVFIVGAFSLKIRFYSTEQVPRDEETIISLANIRNINIVIPRPSFHRFSVAVAVGSNGQFGQLTDKTDSIGNVVPP